MDNEKKTTYLRSLDLCDLCLLRYSGEKKREVFKSAYDGAAKADSEAEQPSKIVKKNPCISCIGLLQDTYVDSVIQMVISEALAADYDCLDFSIGISLPVSFQLRAHSMLLAMMENFPENGANDEQPEARFVSVKDVWKWIAGPKIAKAINKRFEEKPNGSPFSISVNVGYEDDSEESAVLLDMHPDVFKTRRSKPRSDSIMGISRKSVEPLLCTTKADRFKKYVQSPPTVPNHTATCAEVILSHSSVFVAGRYRKLNRHLSQTPWIINDVRLMESSVQELLCDRIVKLARAEDMRFSSSGREDVDVRMLGRGRPFACELVNPRHTLITAEELRAIEKEILSEQCGVEARLLQIVSKDELSILKQGEEEKVKIYSMYCIHPNGEKPDWEALENLCSALPITLEQETPVRVLHRRPLSTRPRTLHWMKVEKAVTEDARAFVLQLATQAGTYVKEFVHGDLGRTKPNLCSLLGVEVDILALDVQDVLLDWPSDPDSTNKTDSSCKIEQETDVSCKIEQEADVSCKIK